ILSAVIFNALIIVFLIPLALKGVSYKPLTAAAMLRRNLWIYGTSSKATAGGAIAFGVNTQATGGNSIAQGNGAIANTLNAISIGLNSVASGQGSVVLGGNAGLASTATVADGVALGSGSVASTAAGVAGYNPRTSGASTNVSSTWKSTLGAVSVGDTANSRTRQITGVAAGSLATDAVNVAQLQDAQTHYYSVNDFGTVGGNYNNDGAVGRNSLAAGVGALSIGQASLAMGNNAVSTGESSIATGYGANTLGINSIALGVDAKTTNSTSTGAIAIGWESFAADTDATAIGSGAKAHKAGSTAIGPFAGAEGESSIAMGDRAVAISDNAIALGSRSKALEFSAIALGLDSIASNANDVALGAGSVTGVTTGTAGATIADKTYTFAGATPTSQVSVGAAGSERLVTNVAAGHLSADSTDAVNGSQLFATNAAINGLDQGAVKYDINTDGTVNYNSITLGGDTYDNSTHTGGTTITNVADGVAPSDAVNMSQLTETNENVTYITDTVNNFAGDQSEEYTEINGRGIRYVRTNDTGLALADAYANGQGSTAVGYNARSTGLDSLALGRDAQSVNEGDVALGAGSVTERAVATTGVTINGVDYAFAGINPLSTVSVGSLGHERTITNVAAGRITSDSTDAVNGSQLFATNSAINSLDAGSVKYDTHADGTVNYNSITLGGDTYDNSTHTGGTTITNVAYGVDPSDAVNVQQLNDATTNIYTNGTKYFHANSEKADSVASGTDSIAVGPNAQSAGDASIAMGDDAKSLGKGSTAIGQGTQTHGENSVAMGSGAVANNANDVALGAGSVTQAAVATRSISINGDTYAVAGNNPTSTVSVGSTGNERTITNVAAGRIAADSTDAVNGSELYATNQAIEKISGDITNLDTGGVKYDTHTDGSVNYNKVTMGGDTYDNTTHTGGTTITNVANGVAPSDAVNKYQLDQVDQHVTNISNGTDGMFQVNNTSKLPKPKPTGKDSTAGGAGAVASGDYSMSVGANSKATHKNSVALGYNSVTDRDNSVSMGAVGNERQVTNVAAGTADTDAANVGQLKQGVNNSYQYTNKKFNDLKNMVDDQKDKLSAGIAGAMATAGLPQPYEAGASMVGLAGGTYQGESAIALGVSTISDNGKWVTKIAGNTNSQGDVGASVGVGYQF
ncbi:YadA-like family protein, partial [Enterobacter cloacae]|uniref:YadA-like family protein n=1 Tax=Enterobacter cloacae TaxID=550 RepID=UPI00331619D1